VSDVRRSGSCDHPIVADGRKLKCGWPYKLPNSSTIVYCNLDLGHDGPWCRVVTMEGETAAAAPRFGVTDLTATEE
jgi:hypothetical protein